MNDELGKGIIVGLEDVLAYVRAKKAEKKKRVIYPDAATRARLKAAEKGEAIEVTNMPMMSLWRSYGLQAGIDDEV